jgi:hypothetical protein
MACQRHGILFDLNASIGRFGEYIPSAAEMFDLSPRRWEPQNIEAAQIK